MHRVLLGQCHVVPIAGILSTILSSLLLSRTSVAADFSLPDVEITLLNTSLSVGESPNVCFKITAPKENYVNVLREGLLYPYDNIVFTLFDPSGHKLPNERPHITPLAPWYFPANFILLRAGESREWTMGSGRRPQIAGKHRLEVQISPLPDTKIVFRKVFEISVHKKTETNIPVQTTVTVDSISPDIEITLLHDSLYVGESPRIQFKITAPQETHVNVMKKSYLRAYKDVACTFAHQADYVTTYGVSYTSTAAPRDRLNNFSTLQAGESRTWTMSADVHPTTAGKHQLKVCIAPLPDRKIKFSKVFDVSVQEISKANIGTSATLTVPMTPHKQPRTMPIELLNVAGAEESNHLIFRRKSWVFNKDRDIRFDWTIVRVTDIDTKSQILGVPKFFDSWTRMGEVWTTVTRKENIEFLLLSRTGDVIERHIVQPREVNQ